jgi:uncharacterized protein YbjT (DUF2867 family)
MSKILTVFGATGNQGGSVIENILEHPQLSKEYKLRGVTRDASKPAAEALRDRGVEMVSAQLNDPESVTKAVQGSAVVFGVTNFWDKMSYDNEVEQGKNIVDAAKAAGVERLIWSTLIHVTNTTKGKIPTVRHFDSKAVVDQYAREQGVPTSFFLPGTFMSFMLTSFRKNEQGVYSLALPLGADDAKFPAFDAARDSGLFVAAILLHGKSTIGSRVLGTSGFLSPNDLVRGFSEATGLKAEFNQIPLETFRQMLPPSSAEELTGNFQLIESPGYYAGEPEDAVEKSIALVKSAGLRDPTKWVQFVKEHFKE